MGEQEQQQRPRGGLPRRYEQLEVRAPAETLDRLRALARRNERSVSGEVRLAVNRHLEAEGA